MINPPQVLPEEPTAVTPHGGFCGGKSQQWLRYPTIALGLFQARAQIVEEERVQHLQDVRDAGVVQAERAALLILGDRLDH